MWAWIVVHEIAKETGQGSDQLSRDQLYAAWRLTAQRPGLSGCCGNGTWLFPFWVISGGSRCNESDAKAEEIAPDGCTWELVLL